MAVQVVPYVLVLIPRPQRSLYHMNLADGDLRLRMAPSVEIGGLPYVGE